MTFTDDDLKRLKEKEGFWRDGYDMRKANPQISESWGWVDGLKIEALLARLKAAEKCIKRHLLDCPDVSHCNCTHVWRKVAGK